MELNKMLRGAILRVHFSDEESNRLIYLDVFEAEAIANHLAPLLGAWIGDLQASEGAWMYEAGRVAGYNQAVKDLN